MTHSSETKDVVVVHYSELGTKGANRGTFEQKLTDDVRRRLGADACKVRRESARIIVELASEASRSRIEEALGRVFGVAWYAFGQSLPWTGGDEAWGPMVEATLHQLRPWGPGKTFKIKARRSVKHYPLNSQEICTRLGQAVGAGTGWTVDLHHPDLVVQVEILAREFLVLLGRTEGIRGLPQSSSGRMVCLFSGGIDSPVAAWLMMRRGARVDLLHFHPYRSSEEVLGTKIARLFEVLRESNPKLKLFLVPHDRYQVSASLGVPTAYETVFFRRFMFRTGEEMACRLGHQALVTGDSLGQVASQTTENLLAVQTELRVPVFQPLIAHDKDDIVQWARKIGVFDLAIEPYKDCCSLLAKKPKTQVPVEIIRRLEIERQMEKMVGDSLAVATVWDGKTLSPFPRPSASFLSNPATQLGISG